MPKKNAAHTRRSKLDLNLLYPQGLRSKLPVAFLKWLINYGRFIVIIVEIIVVATFITRFKYDADLEDLKDQINSRVPYLESLSSDELKIRQTQLELNTIKKTYSLSPQWGQIFKQISEKTPQNIKFTSLTLEPVINTPDTAFRFSAVTNSNNNLIVFINKLKTTPNFKDVNLASISFEEENITFTITGIVKKMVEEEIANN